MHSQHLQRKKKEHPANASARPFYIVDNSAAGAEPFAYNRTAAEHFER